MHLPILRTLVRLLVPGVFAWRHAASGPRALPLVAAALVLPLLLSGQALAADLAKPYAPPPAAGPRFYEEGEALYCTIRSGGAVFYRMPYSQPLGPLPAGLVVEVVDLPFSVATDLFVRIKAPTERVYYGYVPPRALHCP